MFKKQWLLYNICKMRMKTYLLLWNTLVCLTVEIWRDISHETLSFLVLVRGAVHSNVGGARGPLTVARYFTRYKGTKVLGLSMSVSVSVSVTAALSSQRRHNQRLAERVQVRVHAQRLRGRQQRPRSTACRRRANVLRSRRWPITHFHIKFTWIYSTQLFCFSRLCCIQFRKTKLYRADTLSHMILFQNKTHKKIKKIFSNISTSLLY